MKICDSRKNFIPNLSKPVTAAYSGETENTKGAIRRRQLKDRNSNGLKNNNKRTNNDTQSTTQKTYN